MSTETTIYLNLRQRLTSGGFPHGEKLRPEILRKEFNCSANTIREALLRLSTVGLVEFQEQRGFRVPELSDSLQHELTHMRILLECEGACLSIRQGGVAWEARLSAAHHKLSHIESRVRLSGGEVGPLITLWSTAEQEFHETLIDGCGLDVLRQTHLVVYHRFRQQLITSDREFIYIPENIEQHKMILDAALDRDEDAVRERIQDHLSRNLMHPLPITTASKKPLAKSIANLAT